MAAILVIYAVGVTENQHAHTRFPDRDGGYSLDRAYQTHLRLLR